MLGLADVRGVRGDPPSSDYGTYKTVKGGAWPWISDETLKICQVKVLKIFSSSLGGGTWGWLGLLDVRAVRGDPLSSDYGTYKTVSGPGFHVKILKTF